MLEAFRIVKVKPDSQKTFMHMIQRIGTNGHASCIAAATHRCSDACFTLAAKEEDVIPTMAAPLSQATLMRLGEAHCQAQPVVVRRHITPWTTS